MYKKELVCIGRGCSVRKECSRHLSYIVAYGEGANVAVSACNGQKDKPLFVDKNNIPT